jgi:hypothetical protein
MNQKFLIFILITSLILFLNISGIEASKEFPSPRVQIENGMPLGDVQCNGDLNLIVRTNYSGAACVIERTHEILLDRN